MFGDFQGWMSDQDRATHTGLLKAVRVVLFDAVGTVIDAQPDVATVYHRVGKQFGSQLSTVEIERRFRQSLVIRHQQPAESGDRWSTSPQAEYDRWLQIVSDVFVDVDACEPLFESLWQYFEQSSSWAAFDDVAETWHALEQRGLRLGLASNFDQRLETLASNLTPFDRTKLVFHSAGLGCRKPGSAFFRTIEEQLGVIPGEILLVGDNYEGDYRAAREADWCACWLRRGHAATRPGELSDLRELIPLIANS